MATLTSGVHVNQDCIDRCKDLKYESAHRYIILQLDEKYKEVSVAYPPDKTRTRRKLSARETETETEREEAYNEFLAKLPPNHFRWIVYDFEYLKEGGPRNKIIWIDWIPDSYYDEQSKTTKSMPPKEKMAYASSKQQLRAALSEISFQEQFMAAEASDIAYDDVLKKVAKQ